MSFRNLKIGTKLILSFLLIGLLPMLILGYLNYARTVKTMEAEMESKLHAITSIKKNQMENWFHGAIVEMETFARSQDVAALFEQLRLYHEKMKTRPDGPYDVHTHEYSKIHEIFGKNIAEFQKVKEYADIYMVCMAHGHVMYTTAELKDMGTNIRFGPYKDSGLAKLRDKILETGKSSIVDFSLYEPNNNKPALFAGAPIFQDNKLIGMMAVQMPLQQVNQIMGEETCLGKEGETYLVGADYLMRSDSRLSTEETMLKTKVKTATVEAALAGKNELKVIDGYRGNRVWSDAAKLGIQGMNWVIVGEMDDREAMAAVIASRNQLFILLGVIAALVTLAALLFSNSFKKPILKVQGALEQVAQGDLTAELDERG
jgi:methyl-accepting chemotaxis protein